MIHHAALANGMPSNSSSFLPSSSVFAVVTMRTTGGLRMNTNGVQGRVQFNCTTTVSISIVNGSSPQVSVSSSGTTTFEQPLGSTPVTRPCGPA